MLDIESMALAQRIICLKKYIEDDVCSWKFFLDHYLEIVGGKFILHCQFDTRKLPISLPVFYKDCLEAWSSLTNKEVNSYEDIMSQVVWNNKHILCQGKSLYQAFLHKSGIIKVGDLVSKDGLFLKSEKLLKAKITPNQLFFLMGIVDSLPSNWRSVKKGNIFREALQFDENCIQLRIKGELVDLTSTTSKLLYKEFCSHKATPPTAQAKLEDKYPNCSFNGKKIYSLAFSVTLDTKLRTFQYKLLNRIVFTNDKLFRFNIVESPLCTFCTVVEESLEHLLFFCGVKQSYFGKRFYPGWLAAVMKPLIFRLLRSFLVNSIEIMISW